MADEQTRGGWFRPLAADQWHYFPSADTGTHSLCDDWVMGEGGYLTHEDAADDDAAHCVRCQDAKAQQEAG